MNKLIILVFVVLAAVVWVFNPHRHVGRGRHHETTRQRWDRLTRPLRRPGIHARARRRAHAAQARAQEQALVWWLQRRGDYEASWAGVHAW